MVVNVATCTCSCMNKRMSNLHMCIVLMFTFCSCSIQSTFIKLMTQTLFTQNGVGRSLCIQYNCMVIHVYSMLRDTCIHVYIHVHPFSATIFLDSCLCQAVPIQDLWCVAAKDMLLEFITKMELPNR